MRQKIKTHTLHYLTFLIAVFITAGCASSDGMQRSEEVRTTMEVMDNDIKAAAQQLDATGASLDSLMSPDQTDVTNAFDAYSDNVSKMENMEEEFARHREQLRERGSDYFKEWKQEGSGYSNAQIQQLSEQRQAELAKVYGQIAANSVGVSEAFKTYVSDVKEIRSFLSNDLTTRGIAAITPTSRTVVRDGDNLKYALQNMQSAVQRARAEMATGGTKKGQN